MKLTRIRLAGFKSFAASVELPFEEGMTSIVGPNGCGKSNISDAVRWVLGEQRARLLRGQRMEDIIFHGALKHRPVNVAEVSLIFDNSDGALPVAFQEVAVTRRLSRNGQSDYLINQAPVRLRDVQDLLRGTGLGSDAGVVIEAQMIDRLLSDRTEERRSLFEEAAGIGLYRDRKNSTERQLHHTTEDLQRLDDIITEVQREVRSLARQRGKAERHAKFLRDRFAVVMTLARRDLGQLSEQEQLLSTSGTDLELRIPEGRDAVAVRGREREAAVQARHAAEARRTEVDRRLADARLQVERLEGDLKVTGERLQNTSTRRERAVAERGQATELAAQAERDGDAAATERRAAAEARASVQGELDLRAASEDQARTRLQDARRAVRSHEEELQGCAERVRELAGERASLERDLDDLRGQLTTAEEAQGSRRAERDTAELRLREARTEGERLREAERIAVAELERARHALAAAREHERAVQAEQRAAEESLARLTARQSALERLERDREGLAPAARRLLDAREEFGEGAVLGPLSDFLRTSQADAQLVERLFGEWLHAVLVRDSAAIEAVRRWHEEHRPGPLVLLPATGPNEPNPAGQDPLPVEAAEPAAPWARALLSGNEVLDGAGHAIRRASGAVVLSPGDDGAGPLARRAELESLSKGIDGARAEVERLEQECQKAVQAHTSGEASLARAAQGAERARAAYREAQSASDDAARVLQRAERELGAAEELCSRLNERVAACGDRMTQVLEGIDTGGSDRQRLEDELSTQRVVLADLEAQQEAARERRVHWQVEEAQVSAREAAARDREERAVAALEHARAEAEALGRELEETERETAKLTSQRQQWSDTLADRRVTIQELETAAQAAEQAVLGADQQLETAEQVLGEARVTVETLNEESHRVEIQRTELAGRRQVLVERIEAEWHKPISGLLEEAPEVEGETQWLREEAQRLADTLESLGPVNPLAVEEHADEKKRLEFLSEQRDDLVSARNKLHEALREIEHTARAMFVETFAAIRENFQSVFHTLFDGGECDVRLANEEDPLSSEIDIHAAPRGKRTQRIHLLSSGERALVAISLLFAIYLTKPSPFCLLDEVDAPLDDANVARFIRLLSEFKQETQFIVITHNPRTMQVADSVYGVTMQEPGVSTIVGVRLGAVQQV